MFTGQLTWNDPSDLASQPAARGNVANGENPEAAFALLYAEALGIAGEQGADIDSNIDDEGGLLANEDYGGPGGVTSHGLSTKRMPGKPGGTAEETWQSLLLEYNLMTFESGAGEQHFAGKEQDADSHPYSSAMQRFMSQNRAAQVEPAPLHLGAASKFSRILEQEPARSLDGCSRPFSLQPSLRDVLSTGDGGRGLEHAGSSWIWIGGCRRLWPLLTQARGASDTAGWLRTTSW